VCIPKVHTQQDSEKEHPMKLQSFIRFAAVTILIPTAGFAIAQTASPLRAALAETSNAPSTLIAQTATPTVPTVPKDRSNRGEKYFQQLNLSADQQSQIKSIKEQSKTASQGLREQMKTARTQYKTLLSSNDASGDQLRQAHQQVQTLGQQLGEQRFETMLKIRNVLTPEQRTKLTELRQQNRQTYKNHQQQAQSTKQAKTFS
jgi:periplasmic protein CpxP/Spy